MQPQNGDVVLGNQHNPIIEPALTLKGIEGVKSHLADVDAKRRVAALSEALSYGQEGLNLVIQALKDKSEQVQQAAFQLLLQQIAPIEQAIHEHIALISALGVDYSYLRYLLSIRQWQKADDETRLLLLKVAQREGSWLKERDIQRLPSEDLLTIDRLWTRYSGGQFGFSIQSKIWKDINRKVGGAFGVGAFINTVGWHMEKHEIGQGFSIQRQDNIPYALSAPKGHLPTLFSLGGGTIESHQWADPQSDMGLGRDTYTWYEWTFGSFFGPDMVKCFLNRIQSVIEP